MSNQPRRGACPTTQKVCYFDRAAAKHQIRKANMAGVVAFKCDDCGFFHIGGWHGRKDRAAHRGDSLDALTTIDQAARTLDVSPAFIQRLIQAGKVRADNERPYTADIERLQSLGLRSAD